MSTAGFTAEVSLHKSNGRYRIGGHARASSARTIGAIHPAMEAIEVFGCAPGSYLVDNGDGTWDCWSNPDPWWGGGGGGGSGTPGVPYDDGSPGKPGGGKPGTQGRPTPAQRYAERVRRLANLWYDACRDRPRPDQLDCCDAKAAKCIDDSFHPAVERLCTDAGKLCQELQIA